LREAAVPRAWRLSGGRGWGWLAEARLLVAVVLLVPVERVHEAVQFLVFLAVLAGGAFVGWSLAGRWLAAFTRGERAFAAAVLGIATCVVIGVVIGHFGLLTGWWFRGVLAAAVVASTALSLLRRRGEERDARGEARHGGPPAGGYPVRPRRGRLRASGSPPPGAPHVVAYAATVRPVWRLRGSLQLRRVQRAVLWACVLLVGVAFVRTANRYRHVAPGHFSFDDTSYHLTAVGTWAMFGDLRMPRFTYGDPRTPFYPFASELLAWEVTTPFAGGDFAARWIEMPFAVLTLFGIGLVARRVGAHEVALVGPLLYATVADAYPLMAFTAGNDHALALAAVVVAHAALLLWARPAAGVAAYAGVGLGLLLGSKYLGVLYGPLLVGLVVLAVVMTRQRDVTLRARAMALLAGAGAGAVVGGYSYLRNAVTTGNPIFPVSLRIAGLTLPGWEDVAPEKWAASAVSTIDPWRFPWVNVELFGELFRFTMLPAALLAPVAALLLAPRRRRVLYAALFAMPIGVYVLFVKLVEDHRHARYVFAGVAIAAVAVAWLVSRLPPRWRAGVALALAAAAVWPWMKTQPETLLFLPLTLAAGWMLTRPRRSRALRPAMVFAAATVGALALVAAAPGAMRKFERRRFDNERGAGALERLTGGTAVRVAYTGWNQPYLFFGRRMQNAVFMPPVAPTLDTMFYRWRGPLDDRQSPRPRRDWMRNLERLGVEWVVWVTAGAAERPERGWMAKSQNFECVYTDGNVELWRVRR
jgi:hypothetical protein